MDMTNKPFRFLCSGIDSLYMGYNYDLTGGQIDFDDLDYRKALLKEDPKRRAVTLDIGDLRLGLAASGAYPYAFILTHRHFRMKLARLMQPSCLVEYASQGLWSERAEKLHLQVEENAQSLGLVTIAPNIVSRLDYAFDYYLPDPDFEVEHFVSRAGKDNQWRKHGAVQTLQFGSSDVVVRVYHKSAEIAESSNKTWFYPIWGLDEEERQHVWRVEFQFRRAALRNGGIHSFTDINDHLGDILRETATKHTSLRFPSDDSNRSRWPRHPLWEDLLERIRALPHMGLCRDIHQKEDLSLRQRRVIQSIIGSMKGLAALTELQGSQKPREKPPNISQTLQEIERFAARELPEQEWNCLLYTSPSPRDRG